MRSLKNTAPHQKKYLRPEGKSRCHLFRNKNLFVYLVRNMFVNRNSEQVFPRIFGIRFLRPGIDCLFEGLLFSFILLYTFFMLKSEVLASRVLDLQWSDALRMQTGKLSVDSFIYIPFFLKDRQPMWEMSRSPHDEKFYF